MKCFTISTVKSVATATKECTELINHVTSNNSTQLRLNLYIEELLTAQQKNQKVESCLVQLSIIKIDDIIHINTICNDRTATEKILATTESKKADKIDEINYFLLKSIMKKAYDNANIYTNNIVRLKYQLKEKA